MNTQQIKAFRFLLDQRAIEILSRYSQEEEPEHIRQSREIVQTHQASIRQWQDAQWTRFSAVRSDLDTLKKTIEAKAILNALPREASVEQLLAELDNFQPSQPLDQ